jgi:hypothetical protein
MAKERVRKGKRVIILEEVLAYLKITFSCST